MKVTNDDLMALHHLLAETTTHLEQMVLSEPSSLFQAQATLEVWKHLVKARKLANDYLSQPPLPITPTPTVHKNTYQPGPWTTKPTPPHPPPIPYPDQAAWEEAVKIEEKRTAKLQATPYKNREAPDVV